jgi:hypothetical protein
MLPTIFWVLERRHEDGSWKACLSIPRAIDLCHDKLLSARDRDTHHLFSLVPQSGDVLNALGGWPLGGRRMLMKAGLPDNASAYTRERLTGAGQHRHGHYSLADLKRFVRGLHPGVTCPHDCRVMKPHLEHVEIILTRPDWIGEVLVGPVVDGPLAPQHPAMIAESNHARLDRLGYSAKLLPPDGKTVRLCVSFQN